MNQPDRMRAEGESIEQAAFFDRLYQGILDWHKSVGAEIIHEFGEQEIDRFVWNSDGKWGFWLEKAAFLRDNEVILAVAKGVRMDGDWWDGEDEQMLQFQFVSRRGSVESMNPDDSQIVVQDSEVHPNPLFSSYGKPVTRPIDFSSVDDLALIVDPLMCPNGGKLLWEEGDQKLHVDIHPGSGQEAFLPTWSAAQLNEAGFQSILEQVKKSRSANAPVFFVDSRSKFVEV